LASAAILTDKDRFRQWQNGHGYAAPSHRVTTLAEIGEVGLPSGRYVIKPARSSGSKGVFLCDEGDLAARAAETAVYCPDGRIVIEQEIIGRHGTVEGIWSDGAMNVAMITERLTAAPPRAATTGHRYPAELEEHRRQELLDCISRMMRALAIPATVFDCDFVSTDTGPVVLELTPRLGGNSLSRLMRAALGVDLPAEAVRCALRPAIRDRIAAVKRLPPAAPACAVMVLGTMQEGCLQFDAAEEALLRKEPWLAALDWDVPRGHAVRAFGDGRDRVGEALILASDRGELEARCREFVRRLALKAGPTEAAGRSRCLDL
jgi:biotin carboxylase